MKKILLMMVLALGMCSISVCAQERELKVESDGFRWYKVKQNGKEGAQSTNGETIIPSRYDFICYHKEDNNQGWFSVENFGEGEGAYERDGRYIIQETRGFTSVCKHSHSEKGFYYGVEKGDYKGVCDLNGREVISPSRGYTSVVLHGHHDIMPYYSVKKGDYEGVCDLNGREVISPSRGYTSLYKSGDSETGYYYSVEKGNCKGICDLNGKEIIILDNVESILPYYSQRKFFYQIKRNGLWGVSQSNGKMYIATKYKDLYDEKGRFISEDTGSKRTVGYLSNITATRNPLAVKENYVSTLSSSDYEYISSSIPPISRSSYSSSSSSSSSTYTSSSSSSGSNYDYVFEFNTFYLGDKKIDDEAKFIISKSGVIKVEFGGSPFEFKCKSIEVSEGFLMPSQITFYGTDSDDKLELSSTGIIYYDFLSTPISESVKKEFNDIMKKVKNKTIFSSPVPIREK